MEILEPKVPQAEKTLTDLMSEVSLLVVEVEGVLSDGRTLVGPDGGESLFIHRADEIALKTWREEGRQVVIMARSDLTAAAAWCQARGLAFRPHTGAKVPALQAVIFEHQMTPHQICYVGALVDDLPPMMVAGLAAAPGDASSWAQGSAHLISKAPAGNGALAELIHRLLDPSGEEKS